MKVKVYLNEVDQGNGQEVETSMVFVSKEFGWMEYFDDGLAPIFVRDKKEFIGLCRTDTDFYNYTKLTYLGEL
jgi:hypothetical protein